MYNFIKMDKNKHIIFENEQEIGYIICDRGYKDAGAIRGYKVGVKGEILGYGYGSYCSSLSVAKESFIKNYSKYLKHLSKPGMYYAPEVDMYFDSYELYCNFKTTPVYKNKLERMQKG